MNTNSMKSNQKFWLRAVTFASLVLALYPASVKAQSNTFPSTGNVGVGTTAPGAKLEVAGANVLPRITNTDSASYSGLQLFEAGTLKFAIHSLGSGSGSSFVGGANGAQLWNYGNGPLVFGTNSAERMRLSATGFLGIGTTNPLTTLQLGGSTATITFGAEVPETGPYTITVSGSGGATPSTKGTGHGRNLIVEAGPSDNSPGVTGGDLYLRPGFPRAPATQYGNLILADQGGNVGIGTTNPLVPLDIVKNNAPYGGQIRVAASDYGQITFYNSNNLNLSAAGRRGDIYYDFANSRLVIENNNGGAYNGVLGLNPGGGSVGIGTFTPGFKLDVEGGAINSSGGLCIAGDCKTAWSQVGGGGGSSQWTTSGSSVYYNTGNVGIGNASPSTKLQVAGGTRIDGTSGRLYLGTGAVVGARGLEIMEENATTFSIRHHDPNVAWQNIALNPHGGNVGIGTPSPTVKLHVAGDAKINGNLTVDGNIAAKYQDVAEWVPATHALPTGTVVTLDPTKSNHVEASSKAYDTRVAGVISAQPGIVLGEKGENKVLVATTGRVKVKVDASVGAIQVGDLLVSSDIEGVAIKSKPLDIAGVELHRPGTIIGKALESLAKGRGEILVLLSLQ